MNVNDIEKMLIINASPRNNGVCDQIVDKLIDEFAEYILLSKIKVLDVYDLNIEYCTNCDYCAKYKGCIHDDDMINVYKYLNESDSIIIVSPIYFNSIPAPFKTLIDRLQAVYNSKYVLNDSMIDRNKKRNINIYLVGGQKYTEDQFTGASEVLKIFCKAINADYESGYTISNTNNTGKIKDYVLNELKL